ncbi:helix-turn-helix domain-containing protein [Herbidospora mongoliensis]|uniref:helix-turn-helix domain-containing protein n=1 Tax=Herbidospora mongoliensis TaxID=688067 RepID=UPI001470F13B
MRLSVKPRLSVAEAAKRAGVGEATWGNTERGYKTVGRDAEPNEFSPSAMILAHMADVLGLTPNDLHGVDRGDAAEILAEIAKPTVETRGSGETQVTFMVPAGLPEEDKETVRRWAEQMARDLDQRHHHHGDH